MSETNFNMATGSMGRTIVVRLKPGTDVLAGLQAACEQAGIKNGAIVSCLGSLAKVSICNPTEQPESKAGYGYGTPQILHGPWELLGASGVVCHDLDGSTNLHVHINLSDPEGNAYGGHLAPGTTVLITVDAVIAEVKGVEMERIYDDSMGFPILTPRQSD